LSDRLKGGIEIKEKNVQEKAQRDLKARDVEKGGTKGGLTPN